MITSSSLWHHRIGHLNYADLEKTKEMVTGMNFKKSIAEKCEPCIKGKMARKTFKSSSTCSSEILELIHADLCRPMEDASWS